MLTKNKELELKQLFQSLGVRATKKRIAIFHALYCAERALSPYELAQYCESTLSLTIPVVSIYRILDLLVEVNLVHKLEIVNKYSACSHIGCQENHPQSQFLICNVCQKVTEIHLPDLLTKQLDKHISEYGFKLKSTQCEFQGVCASCS